MSTSRIDQAIAMASAHVAKHLAVSAIVALTETGGIVKYLSRLQPDVPVFGFSPNSKTMTQLALYRGVQSVYFETQKLKESIDDESCVIPKHIEQCVLKTLANCFALQRGDRVIITWGADMGEMGSTDSLKIAVYD